MRRARPFLVALPLLVASTAPALEWATSGRPVRLGITSTTIGSWHADNGNFTSCDDQLGVGLERLNLQGSWEEWVVGLRLDGTLFFPPRVATGGSATVRPCTDFDLTSRYLDAVVPEKVWAGWSGRLVEVTVGDSYVSFGRGLSLSLRKTDELGIDTTQRGVRLKLTGDRLSGTLIGGVTNINNLDEASGRWADDPHDAVLGASADVRLWDSLRVGAHAAAVAFRAPVSTFVPPGGDSGAYQERWLMGGPRLEAPGLVKGLGLYLEGLGQRRMHADGTVHSGLGVYGSATGSWGPATLLLEVKSYGDLEVVQPRFDSLEFTAVQYTALPTLERVQQPIEHPQKNITGARLKFDWSIRPDITVYANYAFFRDWEGYVEPDSAQVLPGSISDPYLGIDARLGHTRVHAQAGVRWVMLEGIAVHSDGHFDVDLVHGLEGGSSVEVHLAHQERSKVLVFGSESWREGTLQLGYRKRPHFALSAIVDYTTEAGQPATWYPGGAAEWNLTEASALRLFAGTSRGGLRCVSGACRIFPPFSGVKGQLTLRY